MQIYTSDQGVHSILIEQYKWQIGMMLSPYASLGRKHHYELPLAIDNGAFSSYQKGCGFGFDEWAFLKMLSKILEKNLKYEILVTPDIVAGGKDSLWFSLKWKERLAGWKNQYFAVQDGMDIFTCGSLILMVILRVFLLGEQMNGNGKMPLCGLNSHMIMI